jgi:hypothetical protein
MHRLNSLVTHHMVVSSQNLPMELIIGCGFGVAGGYALRNYLNDDIKSWVPKGPEETKAPTQQVPFSPRKCRFVRASFAKKMFRLASPTNSSLASQTDHRLSYAALMCFPLPRACLACCCLMHVLSQKKAAAPDAASAQEKAAFDAWVAKMKEASPSDIKDTDDFKYIKFTELPPFTKAHRCVERLQGHTLLLA